MKELLIVPLLMLGLTVNATNYYLSSAGNDNNSGTEISTAWKSLSKVNSFNNYKAGDKIYLRRGDVFYGSIIINQSGTSGNPITFGAYGTGAKPIITGFTPVSSWSNLGSNIWESSSSVSALSYLNLVLVNGVNTGMGRYPNSGFLYYQSRSGTTSISSSSLTGTPNWTGADAIIKGNRWVFKRAPITSQSGGTLNISWSGQYHPTENYGFFIQNDARTLDSQNEWYYNPTTKKIRIYSTSQPSNVQVPTISNLVTINSNYITFENISFIGANESIVINNKTYITIDNCDIKFSGKDAIKVSASTYTLISNNNISESNDNGIQINGESPYTTVEYNRINKTGLIEGLTQDLSFGTISCRSDNSIVRFNYIDSSGYHGIDCTSADNTTVNNNFINNSCLIKDDGAGIYTSTAGSNRIIKDNIILNTKGVIQGNPSKDNMGFGIYMDSYTSGTTVSGNTVSGCGGAGGFFSNISDNRISGNTFYNNSLGTGFAATSEVQLQHICCMDVRRNTLTDNIYFVKNPEKYSIFFYSITDDLPLFGAADNNWFCKPMGGNVVNAYVSSKGWPGSFLDLAGWQLLVGQDSHSKGAPVKITDQKELRFEYNNTLADKTISLDASYIDAKGNSFNGSITLAPFTSVVLIKTADSKTMVQNQRKFFVSNSGNDINDGNSPETAWKTIEKVNSFSILAGDTVLFKRGDTFYGTLLPKQSGTQESPIVFGAYGTGNKPIITGLTSVTTWTNVGSNIWESTNQISSLPSLNVVLINGKPAAQGRYPNSGFLTFQSHSGNTSITSSDLSGSWIGGEIAIRTNRWTIERSKITGQTAATLNFAAVMSTPMDGWGFFIQNDARTLDAQNEWYYNPSTRKIRVYNTSQPSGVQVASLDSLVYSNWTSNYITIENLNFVGANRTAVKIFGDKHVTVQNCDISYCGIDGINYDHGADYFTATNNTISNCYNGGIIGYDLGNPNFTATGNTITNIMRISGAASPTWGGSVGAIQSYGDNGYIRYNRIDSVGHSGIGVRGYNTQIRNNFVSNYNILVDDGGGIYTGFPETGKVIDGNILINSVGNNEGSAWPEFYGHGIYLDDNSAGTTVSNNTIAGNSSSAILVHNNFNMTISGNTLFNNNLKSSFLENALCLQSDDLGNQPIRNIAISNNIFFGKSADQGFFFYYNKTSESDMLSFGTSDNNYYVNPLNTKGNFFIARINSVINNPTLSGWKDYSKKELNSFGSPKAITDSKNILFEFNASESNRTISLSGNYLDAKGTVYTGSVTLKPYTSIVLIKDENATVNIAPVANAGSAKTITLPVNNTSLAGSGTDADGQISSFLWTKVSGPSSYNIVSSTTATTNVTGLVAGVYQFELKVTDNSGAIAKDTVSVTVNSAVNIAPVANAGSSKTITLPVNYISLAGSGTDADGQISGYLWTKISGPSSYTITSATTPTTNVSGLVAGVYQFELKVTDNSSAIAKDTVSVTVNAAVNIAPVANAGSSKTITLPVNYISLAGSGTDADGQISGYLWTKISGPSSYTITSATTATTNVSGLVAGVYQFELKVTDNSGAIAKDTVSVTVNAAVNIEPVANAGSSKTITLPVNYISLAGSGTDADGQISGYLWTKISGPSSYTITSATTPTTNVSGLVAGVYQFELKVTDNSGAIAKDTMSVTVNVAVNIEPVANAGSAKTITLPVNYTSLAGSGTDADGQISGYLWTKISGPSSYTITSATTATTNVSGLVAGVYQFQLKVTDNSGAIAKDTVSVTVNAAVNIEPVANAGSSKTITLPVNYTSLAGSGTDADGQISSFLWTKISGPSSYKIVNVSSPVTDLTGLSEGVYEFEFKVTDNSGATSKDTVSVTVNAAVNIAPVANAGSAKTITLPVNYTSLAGGGTDADGQISSYLWTKISGPSSYTITSATTPTTNVSGLVAGVYQFELKVTDNSGTIAKDTVSVTVNAAVNIAPVANAGSAKTITLPVNYTSLAGGGTDADGQISSYLWTKISGPSSYTITSATTATTNVSGLVAGVYQFELKVTDNSGATSKDTASVTVNAAINIAPVANAGSSKTITLPVNYTSLAGSGTDADGQISGYLWTKISGPSSYTITSATTATTNVSGLVAGVYQFELKVTDNSGATSKDTVSVTVNAAVNIAPVANAGSSKTITLPVNYISLAGSGTDADGQISSYLWTKISGPSSYTIVNASSPVTDLIGLSEGVYEFEFKVTDNFGATGRDTMKVFVSSSNISPTANAGNDITITSPLSSVTIIGSGSDPDGKVVRYFWQQISGPSSSTINNGDSAVTVVTDLVAGTYQFELTVTDNKGSVSKDTMIAIVALGRFATELTTVKLFPNPVINNTNVEIQTPKQRTNLQINMCDVNGKVLYSKKITSSDYITKQNIDMQNFSAGTYFLSVYSNNKKIESIKVVKL